jgi:threonine dehydrogenase-like Zn-dependent dehydrogenase
LDAVKLAVLRDQSNFAIEEIDKPSFADDEVLVRVAACGVCASELEMWTEHAPTSGPRYLGHEVSGVVAAVGADVEALRPGDRVGCWVTSHGYAEYVAVRAAYCTKAGPGPLELALAEPLACAVNAVEAADVRLGDDVVLVGAGFMGNLVQMLVALRGPRQLIVADTRPDALARAKAAGATSVVDIRSESLADVVGRLTDARGADISFECTGTQAALSGLGGTTRMSGKLAIVGFHQGADRQIPLAAWNWMAFTIVNAHFREAAVIMQGMTIGMKLLSAGLLSMENLVTHRFELDDINAAFDALRSKPDGFAKAVITFPGAD